jgi:hypothetical protein
MNSTATQLRLREARSSASLQRRSNSARLASPVSRSWVARCSSRRWSALVVVMLVNTAT